MNSPIWEDQNRSPALDRKSFSDIKIVCGWSPRVGLRSDDKINCACVLQDPISNTIRIGLIVLPFADERAQVGAE